MAKDSILNLEELRAQAKVAQEEVRQWPIWQQKLVKAIIADAEEVMNSVYPRKVVRNLSTPESTEYWRSAEDNAAKIESWPAWKRGGINIADQRSTPRTCDKKRKY